MQTNLKPLSPSAPTTPTQPEFAAETGCSIEGGCPPSHRAMRRVATFIIGVLLLSLLLCGAYLLWSHSL